MIDSNLWRELAVFEECGTLSKASEKLFISQPALSRSMNRLEEELGITIFTRSKNKLTLMIMGNWQLNMLEKLLDMKKML